MKRQLAAAALIVLATGCKAGTPKRIDVSMQGFAFVPGVVEAQPGDTIVWTNADMVPHTATAAGAFDTGNMDAGASKVWVAGARDSIDYVCTYHPTMKGTVVVR